MEGFPILTMEECVRRARYLGLGGNRHNPHIVRWVWGTADVSILQKLPTKSPPLVEPARVKY